MCPVYPQFVFPKVTQWNCAQYFDRLPSSHSFLNMLTLETAEVFEPEEMRAEFARHADCESSYDWNLQPFVLEAFLEDAERASRPSAVTE